ncbi:hypothetical protein COT52_02505 [candidate division WWE3 bacterium CG08_land_8_20_14_0_20_43_13]|uniref:Uncharacterized protein n=1 Tax=candidate division WWE3 bacterium CG08_land_8_20_14_0_20_43_13 TaxID=1975087 RepID=A0A2H0X932_UNCKA|nr:MAG: hypothetical protein COT52_02505 [candidate division WWE3 bacterium CG08_land_8_20_14_0_20_43_13]
MTIKNILKITKKELVSYLNSPTTYLILIGFLTLWQYFFFKNFFLIGEVSVRNLFNILPWFLVFVVPAFTMASFSAEQKEGTLETLLTKPISELELVIGKFLAILTVLGSTILLSAAIPLSISNFGRLEWGVTFCQYLGAILTLAMLVSLGIYISSLTKNQVLSLLASAAGIFLLVISGQESTASNIPNQIYSVIQQFSLNQHTQTLNRGVIDNRDLIYFLSLSAIFLVFAWLSLLRAKFGSKTKYFAKLWLTAIALTAIAILINMVGAQIPGRLDLTVNKIYTLSNTTKRILQNLPDVVNITFYQSQQLPDQIAPLVRDTTDTLLDYKKAAHGKINIKIVHPDQDPALENEAIGQGITALQFNVVSQQEYQIKKGYLGISVNYLDSQEPIPSIQTTDDLEYQLTSLISQLTKKEKPLVIFLSGHGEKTTFSELAEFKNELSKQYTVEEKQLDESDPQIPEGTKALILAGPTEEINQKEQEVIIDYVKKGGALLALVDTVIASPQTMSAYANSNGGKEIPEALGITINPNLVYDLASNESVNLGGPLPLLVRYPMWLRAFAYESFKIDYVTLPWPSSVKASNNDLETITLLTTSQYAGQQTQNYNISPNQQWSEQNLGLLNLALGAQVDQGRLAVVGDSDFLTQDFVGNAPANLAFGLKMVGWLTRNSLDLAEIKHTSRLNSPLIISSKNQTALLQYGNMIGISAVVLILGISWITTRERRVRQKSKILT